MNAECFMESIASETGLDPIAVRLANLDPEKKDFIDLINELKEKCQYEKRRAEVETFNKLHRFKKRGIASAWIYWPPLAAQYLNVTVSVYHIDGSICITLGGVDMGQGMNTKAAQACAYYLDIPIEKVNIKISDTMIAPNNYITGGSTTTKNAIIGVKMCCDILLERLKPIRELLGDAPWPEVVKAAHVASVNLQANGHTKMTETSPYSVNGIAICIVEVDVLTGERQIIKACLLHDIGRSLNPGIDVGQVSSYRYLWLQKQKFCK